MRRASVTLLVLLAMFVVAGGAAADGPTITIVASPDSPVAATSMSGAVVTLTATDQDGNSVDVTCAPASGSVFPIGTTSVSCSTTDGAEANIDVTVVDTPPMLSLPSDISITAHSPSGTPVDYTATASDLVDGAIVPDCSPAPGSTFAVGSTTVNCSATDSANQTTTGSFTVTVLKPEGPTFSNVPTLAPFEATGQSGAAVTYTPPTATDANGEPLLVSCDPASGTTLPLGDHPVRCNTSDAFNTPAQTTFTVTVRDTMPPILAVPGPTTVQATSADGISASATDVAQFLASPVAEDFDLVDPSPAITNNAPAHFPIGDTTVTFTARDASGNKTVKASKLTVVAPPPPTTTTTTTTTTTPAPQPPAPTPAPTPTLTPAPTPTPTPPQTFKPPVIPPNASGFRAISGRGRITLQWTLPAASGVDHVELLRAQATAGAQATVIYRGTGRSFVDRNVKDGANYRYQLVSVDSSGNRSAGVAVTAFPLPLRLLAPLSGAKLRTPPTLRWLVTAGASYYNLQLYRNGVKVLSVWPTSAKLRLPRTWKYLGHTYTFASGSYRWYVWAGFGARSAQKYSPLLGQAFFTVPA